MEKGGDRKGGKRREGMSEEFTQELIKLPRGGARGIYDVSRVPRQMHSKEKKKRGGTVTWA